MSQDYLDIDKKLQSVDRNDIWENFINTRNYDFRHAVWSNQRVSYLSGFSAYDNFIVKIVKDKLKLDEYRRTSSDFYKDIKRVFGEETGKIVWNDGEILILREIRNSLAHEGGKINDKLKKLKHECVLEDDVIQITPKDIKRLFSAITCAVEAIVSCSRDNECLNRKQEDEKFNYRCTGDSVCYLLKDTSSRLAASARNTALKT